MRSLGEFTQARVSLGLTGSSLPTGPLLDFRLAHARARDAVHLPMDVASVSSELEAADWRVVRLHSAARDRGEYLRRPDKGRALNAACSQILADCSGTLKAKPRLVIVLADGLSALAVHRHGAAMLRATAEALGLKRCEANPIFIAEQARVALGDDLGEALGAELLLMLIGERPGLTAPDSLGIYLTWSPRRGRTDAERNCISNIHEGGLSYQAAAGKLAFLVSEARRRRLSGVSLKESASNYWINSH